MNGNLKPFERATLNLAPFMRHGDEDYPSIPVGFLGGRLVSNHSLPNGRQRKLHDAGSTI
jgi:hypothetical protein